MILIFICIAIDKISDRNTSIHSFRCHIATKDFVVEKCALRHMVAFTPNAIIRQIASFATFHGNTIRVGFCFGHWGIRGGGFYRGRLGLELERGYILRHRHRI